MSSRAASLKYQSAGHQSLSALELSQSILNEVTLAGFILLNFFFSLPPGFLCIFLLYHLPEIERALKTTFFPSQVAWVVI